MAFMVRAELSLQTRAPWGPSQDRHAVKISSSKPPSSPSAPESLPAPAYPSYGDALNQILNSILLSAGWLSHCHCDNPIVRALWLQIPLGLGTAASVQVGNALGAGDAKAAKRSSTTSLICTGQSTTSWEVSSWAPSRGAGRVCSPLPASFPQLSVTARLGSALCCVFRGVLRNCGGHFSLHEERAGIHLHQGQVSAPSSWPCCVEVSSQK